MAKVDQDKIPAPATPDNSADEIAALRLMVEELKAAQAANTGNMIPARPGLDLEAKSVGKADGNATTSGTDRSPDGQHLPQVAGPRIGDRREFLPAEYPTETSVVNAAGESITFTQRRRDR